MNPSYGILQSSTGGLTRMLKWPVYPIVLLVLPCSMRQMPLVRYPNLIETILVKASQTCGVSLRGGLLKFSRLTL